VSDSGSGSQHRANGEEAARPGAARWVPRDAGIATLRSAARECRGCELWRDATQVVFSMGPGTARIMLVGEQPGDVEDRRGAPFVGPAGRVLADAVEAAGIPRENLYVTNAVKHFRFEARGKQRIHKTPGPAHVAACHPWLEAEVSVVDPDVIVCLGATAGKAMLGRDVRIGAERGRLLSPGDAARGTARILITAHPSAVLRLRGHDGYEEAFAALVADLGTAAAGVRR
jgi:uracil-DNA glycosylase family protein